MSKTPAKDLQSRVAATALAAVAAVATALDVAEAEAMQRAAAVTVTTALATQKADLKSYAAAVAVAAALAGQSGDVIYIQPPSAQVSAWQLTMRSYQLNLRNQSFNRKPRGNTR
jgi:hypothetical protein